MFAFKSQERHKASAWVEGHAAKASWMATRSAEPNAIWQLNLMIFISKPRASRPVLDLFFPAGPQLSTTLHAWCEFTCNVYDWGLFTARLMSVRMKRRVAAHRRQHVHCLCRTLIAHTCRTEQWIFYDSLDTHKPSRRWTSLLVLCQEANGLSWGPYITHSLVHYVSVPRAAPQNGFRSLFCSARTSWRDSQSVHSPVFKLFCFDAKSILGSYKVVEVIVFSYA